MKVIGFIFDAILDSQRRKHVVSRIIESFVPSSAIIAAVFVQIMPEAKLAAFIGSLCMGAMITVLEFALYEFVLEPLGKTRNPIFTTGRYWERGPREDETYTRP